MDTTGKSRITLTLIIFYLISSCFFACNSDSGKHPFSGRLLVASDADMVATAYVNGGLNKVKGIEDSLTLITFETARPELSQIHVSNSVMSWPAVLEYADKHQIAYVAESKGIHNKDTNAVANVWKDMPNGKFISLIDLAKPSSLKLMQKEAIGENIFSVAVNSAQNLLATSSTVSGKELAICTLEDGKISSKFYFLDSSIHENTGIPSLAFHPHKNILALNINNTHLAFYRIYSDNNQKVSIEKIGKTIEVSIKWSEGKWFNNGQYFMICDYALDNPLTNGNGSLKTIAFDPKGDHKIVSELKTGLSTKGFDLSMDNKYAIAVNMGRSYLPADVADSIRIAPSLTLVKVNKKTGQLKRLGGDYSFEGALPEDAAFDLEGNTIAVAVYHKIDEIFPRKGFIEFWEIEQDSLRPLPKKVFLTRGPHTVKTIP